MCTTRESKRPKLVDTSLTDFMPGALDYSNLPTMSEPHYSTMVATRFLNKALLDLLNVQDKTALHELGWYIDRNMIKTMYQWIVELHTFESTLPLAQDMKKQGITSIVLELRFSKDYPYSPPFVRVIRPRFLPFMHGGGGHVTGGGAMCMELLTNTGWSAASSLESVLLHIRLALSNLQPQPARLLSGPKQSDYGVEEAMEAYRRVCKAHGWEVPPNFQDLASTSAMASGT